MKDKNLKMTKIEQDIYSITLVTSQGNRRTGGE